MEDTDEPIFNFRRIAGALSDVIGEHGLASVALHADKLVRKPELHASAPTMREMT